ncbi:hypothetical protein KGQ20_39245 [Catenulispora sp. NF23]|uniref:hypothetical protein n=1 Tax=Catenulispora pinistramenti TaxID=2705254 RepID=UPI001BA60218|nr:hypothetical protein [Catenulispora pinistramenti]MBS2538800.1 hypothetical protein [Catenulispora pinistramenti]
MAADSERRALLARALGVSIEEVGDWWDVLNIAREDHAWSGDCTNALRWYVDQVPSTYRDCAKRLVIWDPGFDGIAEWQVFSWYTGALLNSGAGSREECLAALAPYARGEK